MTVDTKGQRAWPRRALASVIAGVALSFSSVGFADTGESTISINLRGGMGTNFPVVTTLAAGQKVTIVEYNGDFAKVRTAKGTEGYLKTKYLKVAEPAVAAAPAHVTKPAPKPAAVAVAPVAAPAPALAAAPASGNQAVKLDRIQVTGSRIKRVDVEGPTPVTVIDRDMIERLGYTNVQSILGDMTNNSGGTFDIGTSFQFARGSASIDLRGFGAGRTLILIDGRRLPVFPQGLGGTDGFVDLSSIPASLVERVEVLLDGASAVYGSDAISGVVNIITRKDLNGSSVSVRVSGTQDGGGSATKLQFSHGISTADSSVQMFGEFQDQNVLRFTDRDYSDSDFNNGGNGSGYGSSFLTDDGDIIPAPNCGEANGPLGGLGVPTGPDSFCRFDRSKYRQWTPDSKKSSFNIRATKSFGDIEGYARIGIYRGEQTMQLEPNAWDGGESAAFIDPASRIIPGSAFDPANDPGWVAPGASNNPTTGSANEVGGEYFRRLVEFGPRGNDLTTESYNGLVGMSGSFGLYDWDIGLSRNEVRITSYTPTVLSSVLDNEVANNGLDLFQPIPPDVVLRTSHLQTERAASKNTSIDATISGPVPLELSGGPVQFALHGVQEDQSYFDVFDPISTVGDVLDGGNGGGGERSYYGVGLEFSLPILENLEAGIAGRFDSYDDQSETGSAFSPSVHLAYRPINTVLLRASWGESFRAPDLQRLFGSSSNGFDDVVDTVRCSAAGGTDGTAIDPNDPDDPCLSIQSVPAQTGANSKLEEEKGENLNLGIVWEAFSNFTVGLDWYNIEVTDLVSDLSPQQILRQCAARGAFCDQIRRAPDGTLGTPSAGGANSALISAQAQNIATQEITGHDLTLAYKWKTSNLGSVDTEFKWSHVDSLKVQSLSDQPAVEQVGFGESVVIPEDRYSWTTDWSKSNYGITLRADLIGKYPGAQVGGTERAAADEFVDEFLTIDVQGRVDFGSWGLLRLGVDNLFNEEFSKDPTFRAGTPGVQNQYIVGNPSFFSNPFGATGYLQYEFTF